MIFEFSPWFQLFAGLNLAYAGSKRFRDEIDNEITNTINSTREVLDDRINSISAKLIVGAESINTAESMEEIPTSMAYNIVKKHKLGSVHNEFNAKINTLKELIPKWAVFQEGFTSLFLCSGISCLVLLIVGSYEMRGGLDTSVLHTFILSLGIVNIFYFGFLFLRSLSLKTINKPIKPFLIVTAIIVVLVMFVSFQEQLCPLLPQESLLIKVSISITVIPYLNHLTRAFLTKFIFTAWIYWIKFKADFRLWLIQQTIK